jgi:hypothetical protein
MLGSSNKHMVSSTVKCALKIWQHLALKHGQKSED